MEILSFFFLMFLMLISYFYPRLYTFYIFIHVCICANLSKTPLQSYQQHLNRNFEISREDYLPKNKYEIFK